MDRLTGETVEVLQQLIRNECVNDGTRESGGEGRNSELLRGYITGAGLDIEEFEPTPGRTSMVARIEGSDPGAPTVCLMGHTDVVPVTPAGWSRDPFGGELVEGEVWGRGAIDMLNLTASMAVAVRHLADSGFRPKGTLLYFAVADEEAGGSWGAGWMAEHNYDAIRSDYVLTESGGLVHRLADGTQAVGVTVAEKGMAWRRLRVKGTPAHGSMPYGADNALVTAAEAVTRLAAYRAPASIPAPWAEGVRILGNPDAWADPSAVDAAVEQISDPRLAKMVHATTHTTFSPNVCHGGVKTNVIPDVVDVDVDIRTLPGESGADVERHLRSALGDLYDRVEITALENAPASESAREGPLWDALTKVVQGPYPGARLVPRITTGGTDARFFRDKGAIAYGFGLFSPDVTFESFANRFHGHDERVDVETLRLTTEMWMNLVPLLVG
jgi:acetylornithine deacetylase/succinyl-diaminopimelate desuccinylase-like protein